MGEARHLPLDLESPTPKSLVLDLLASCEDERMPVSALVAAGRSFGMAENSVRMALGRLVSSGLVDHTDRSYYRLADSARHLQAEIARWREMGQHLTEWEDDWIVVYLPTRRRRLRRKDQRSVQRVLAFMGFRALDEGLELRPDNIRGGVDRVREELHARGLPRTAIIFEVRGLDAARDRRARGLWDTRELLRSYRRAVRSLEYSAERLSSLRFAEALAETFLLAGHVERQLVLDPRLPEPIVSADERAAVERALEDYLDRGTRFWSEFARDFGVKLLRPPLGTALIAEAKEVGLSPVEITDAVGI